MTKNSKDEGKKKGSTKKSAESKDDGTVTLAGFGKTISCLTIIGEIEGHVELPPQNKTTKYEHVIPQIVTIEEDPQIEGLLVILNTVGGDIEAGLALAELIAGMKKPVVSLVLGGGHSIGVPLAVAADFSFIAPSASMTIHPVRTTGMTLGARQSFEYFRKMQQRINNFVASNSNISPQRYNELVMTTGELAMDVGTVLEGREAVDAGLIDSVGNLHSSLDKLRELIKNSK